MTSTRDQKADCPGPGAFPRLPEEWSTATTAVHAGHVRTGFQEMSEALFLTQGYVYDSPREAAAAFDGDLDRFTYSRYENPTVTMFEERMAALEGAEACYATATGMAAIFAAFAAVLRQGSRVVAARAIFGSTITLLDDVFAKWGVHTDYVDAADIDSWAAALATPADIVFFETPSNPMHDIVDVAAVSRLAKAAGAMVVVDNVLATPVLQRPLPMGADIIVYSATKHIDGQGRTLGGAVLGSEAFVRGPLQQVLRTTGPSLSPFNAWVLLKGLETLPLRVRHASAQSLELARWLEARPEIAAVHYPFLDSHPHAALAREQMSGGGTVVTFDLAGRGGGLATTEETFAFLEALRLIAISNNLGDSKSMITHPATTTARRLGPEGQAATGISAATVRLSVGLEDLVDLQSDIDAALAEVHPPRYAA